MTYQLFNSNFLFYCSFYKLPTLLHVLIFLNPQKIMLQLFINIYFIIIVNTHNFVGCKVFIICFNFSQRSVTFKWGWGKKMLHSSLNCQVSLVMSPTLNVYQKITKTFVNNGCTWVALFHCSHQYLFVFSQSQS